MYDIEVRHEYLHLLKRMFGDLSAERQLHLLKMIDQYKMPDFAEAASDENDSQVQKHTKYARYMKLRFLSLIRDDLPQERKKCHAELVVEFGEPEHPDFDMYVTSWTGPTIPLNEDQIERMPEDELIKYLESWNPSGDSFAPSIDGLSGVLSSVVTKEPTRFAAIVWKLKNLPLMYIREVLRGFENALTNGNAFPWDDLIDFCVWIAEQPRDTPTAIRRAGDDRDWGLTRRYLASLLSSAFQEGPCMVPLTFRNKVWKILDVLTEDPHPTPEHESRYGGQNMDPPTLCINTTRGEAMHCLIRYALWVYSDQAKVKSVPNAAASDFDSMPEVKEKLERHLNAEHDPSLAIRSAYGRFFPWLARMAPAWAIRNAPKIFPVEEGAKPYWEAAWGTYVVFCRPYNEVFGMLSEYYREAIKRIGAPWTTKAHLKNPEECLADHLVTFYWRGILTLNQGDGLMDLFWSTASDGLKYHALHHVGWTLKESTFVEPAVLERMKALWEYRLRFHGQSGDPRAKFKELSAFALWFLSPHLDRQWKISNLAQALKHAAKPINSFDLMDEFCKYAEEFPQEVLVCLEYLVGEAKEPWEIGCHEKDLMEILTVLVASQDKTIRQGAENLVHHMGRIGRFEFRKLLSVSTPHKS